MGALDSALAPPVRCVSVRIPGSPGSTPGRGHRPGTNETPDRKARIAAHESCRPRRLLLQRRAENLRLSRCCRRLVPVDLRRLRRPRRLGATYSGPSLLSASASGLTIATPPAPIFCPRPTPGSKNDGFTRPSTGAWTEFEFSVIGAIALDLFGLFAWRQTDDLDVSIAISVEDIDGAVALLPGWSRQGAHRWRTPDGLRVDILPLGKKAQFRPNSARGFTRPCRGRQGSHFGEPGSRRPTPLATCRGHKSRGPRGLRTWP